MKMHRKVIGLQQLLEEDLDQICADLASEFGEMSGRRLLVTGGGGFLGYYLVQSVLHWNDKHAAGEAIRVVVYDNYVRGVPDWLEALSRRPDVELRRQDVIEPLPTDMGHFDWIVHAAGIASPIYYRAQPLKCIDANINGLRNLLDYAVAERDAGRALKGFLFYSSSEIYGDPAPSAIPTPETYRGNVSCTGPRACYDESKRFGETLCVVYAEARGLAGAHRPAVQQLRTRTEDYGRTRHSGFRRATSSPGETSSCCPMAVRSGRSATRPMRLPAISRCSCAAATVRPTTSASTSRRSRWRSSRISAITAARDLFGYRGKVVLGNSAETDYLVDNPNRRCPVIDKARNDLGFDPKMSIEEGIYRSLIWYSHNQVAAAA